MKRVIELLCTKVIEPATFRNRDEYRDVTCDKPAVLQVNDDCACEEHAPELAQLSGVPWKRKK